MRIIVAPTNFSGISLNAVNYAADLAAVTGASLSLVYVCILPVTISEVPVPAFSIDEMIADGESELIKIKEKLLERTANKIIIHTEVLLGDVELKLMEYCVSVEPYAVVMGSESYNAVERAVFGGKTVSALQHLTWPLIVVPQDVSFSSINKIGLACDFKEVSETIPVDEIRSLVKTLHAQLHILHAMIGYETANGDETFEGSEWLMNQFRDLNPEYHFMRGGDIERNICEFAKKNKLDLLIIIPKKHNIISKMFKHSHSKRLVLNAHVPVMAIHD